GEVLLDAGEFIPSLRLIKKMSDAGLTAVRIRTIMTCHAHRGVCQKCYGWDLSTSRPVNIGTAVGIIAAQSIGEPGTQLTMRTFHTGGVAGEDITHGLPRVTELFEARRPKGQAVLSEIVGTLQVRDDKVNRTLTVSSKDGEFREYIVTNRATLFKDIEDGSEVQVGQQLTKGSVNPHDLLRLTDTNTTLRYIVSQVQNVYISQGVDINDKHIEVIARQMLRKVSVTDAGDSNYLPGKQVDAYEFKKEAERIAAEGGIAPTAMPLLLGITKASLATESYLSAASFQETTKVLTDAAIEGRTDDLLGLKENVIIGKPIPAGTGLRAYTDVPLTYKGELMNTSRKTRSEILPDYAPDMLRELEAKLPQAPRFLPEGTEYSNLTSSALRYLELANTNADMPAINLDSLRLYIYDDLGVSQRWANKFSEAGIETVGDLIGKNEEELLRIEGIGAKAIEELKAGLEARDLLSILEYQDLTDDHDISSMMSMMFSSDDSGLYVEGEVPLSYSADPTEGDYEILVTGQGGLMTDDDEFANLLGSIGLSLSPEEEEGGPAIP
ncbi:MAG: DNA-directed RNA polymerase subunit beta', partial [Coriobacteriia bacterium]|nr:DNA-directed RNA polymerase subunit beta' [Coriobacteriia bacterium]